MFWRVAFPLASFGAIASLSSERNVVNKSSALTMNRFPLRCGFYTWSQNRTLSDRPRPPFSRPDVAAGLASEQPVNRHYYNQACVPWKLRRPDQTSASLWNSEVIRLAIRGFDFRPRLILFNNSSLCWVAAFKLIKSQRKSQQIRWFQCHCLLRRNVEWQTYSRVSCPRARGTVRQRARSRRKI